MKLSKNSGPTTDLTNFKTASVWIRFMAMVYETILLVGPIFFSILVCSLFKAYIFNDNSEGTLHPVFVQLLVLFLNSGILYMGLEQQSSNTAYENTQFAYRFKIGWLCNSRHCFNPVLNSSTFNINWHLVNKRIFPK